jgi:hypothetical protein
MAWARECFKFNSSQETKENVIIETNYKLFPELTSKEQSFYI